MQEKEKYNLIKVEYKNNVKIGYFLVDEKVFNKPFIINRLNNLIVIIPNSKSGIDEEIIKMVDEALKTK